MERTFDDFLNEVYGTTITISNTALNFLLDQEFDISNFDEETNTRHNQYFQALEDARSRGTLYAITMSDRAMKFALDCAIPDAITNAGNNKRTVRSLKTLEKNIREACDG